MEAPKMHNVKSSNLAAVGMHDGGLVVHFKNGAKWKYQGVPEELFQALLKAESAGKYFLANIRDKYSGAPI